MNGLTIKPPMTPAERQAQKNEHHRKNQLKRELIEHFFARAFLEADKFGVSILYGRGSAVRQELVLKNFRFTQRT